MRNARASSAKGDLKRRVEAEKKSSRDRQRASEDFRRS